MGVLKFLEDNGVSEGFQPELLDQLDGPGAAAIITSYGVPPGPPVIPISGLKAAVPNAAMWLQLLEMDIAMHIQVPMLAGATSLMALGPPAPAGPITPSAQLAQPSLLMDSLKTNPDKVLGVSKAMLEWAISLIPAGDPRLLGAFTVVKPSPPPPGTLVPAALGAAALLAIIVAVLIGIPDDQVNKDQIKASILSMLGLSNAELDSFIPVAESDSIEGSDPSSVCACD